MKFAKWASIGVAAALCSFAVADEVEQGDAADKAPAASQVKLETPKLSPTQILCVKQRRTGSRMQQTKCQTVAKWQQEIYQKDMRRSLIRARGRAASWEIAP